MEAVQHLFAHDTVHSSPWNCRRIPGIACVIILLRHNNVRRAFECQVNVAKGGSNAHNGHPGTRSCICKSSGDVALCSVLDARVVMDVMHERVVLKIWCQRDGAIK